jgi:hypothetical protein
MCRSGTVCACFVGLAMVTGGLGENKIREWSGHDPNDLDIGQFDRTVVIKAPGTYKLEALDVDPNDPNTVLGLGDFQEIKIDDNCPAGTVDVYILRDPNEGGGPGALDVYFLHLDPNNLAVIGNIAELEITGDLGDDGSTTAIDSGPLTVDGSLKSDLVIDDDITGDMTFGGLAGNISCDSMQDLTVTRSEEPLFTPSVTVRGAYSHTISVPHGVYNIQFDGTMSGAVDIGGAIHTLTITTGGLTGTASTGTGYNLEYLYITGDLSGSVTSGADIWAASIDGNVSGTLSIGTDLGDINHWNYVEIDGDVNGTAESPALISIGQDLVSKLSVSGSTGPYATIDIAHDLKNHGGSVGLHLANLYGDVLVGNDLIGWSAACVASSGSIDVTGNMPGYFNSGSSFAGDLSVGGDFSGVFTLFNYDPTMTPHLTGTIAVTGDLTGDIHVLGTLGAPTDPNDPETGGYITVDGGMDSTAWIEFGGSIEGTIEFADTIEGWISTEDDFSGHLLSGSFLGDVDVTGDFDGAMTLTGSTLGGTISVGGNFGPDGEITTTFTGTGSHTTAAIDIGGALSGTMDIFKLDAVGLGPSGYIRVAGAFDAPGEITFAGPVTGSGSYVTFGYSGWNENVYWDPNAVINVRDPNDPNTVTVYNANTPSAKLYCVTSCRGDMNNDGLVNTSDVRPFLQALNYPNTYNTTYPGLAGSRVWHGDADCDLDFDADDEDPFMVLVQRQCCDPDCPGCQGDGLNGDDSSPEQFAAELAEAVGEEYYDDLLGLIDDLIAAQDENQEYWQAVYAALTQ